MDHWPGHRPRWRWHGEVQRIAPHPATPTQIRSVMYEIGTPGSLEASDWFDELALDPEAHPVAMGTRALGDRPWLVADRHRDHELAIKNELLSTAARSSALARPNTRSKLPPNSPGWSTPQLHLRACTRSNVLPDRCRKICVCCSDCRPAGISMRAACVPRPGGIYRRRLASTSRWCMARSVATTNGSRPRSISSSTG